MTPKPTRERLLDAARDLLRDGGVAAVTMVAVAREADVSRQAAYLHFADRSDLLVALVDRIDKEKELERYYVTVREAPTAAAAIEAWARMQLERNPRIAALARALDAERHTDSASAAAWRSRTGNRLAGARVVVERLADEGRLHASWPREYAAVFLAELTSFRVWDDLVNEARVPGDTYVQMIKSAILSSLAAPLARSARRAPSRSLRTSAGS